MVGRGGRGCHQVGGPAHCRQLGRQAFPILQQLLLFRLDLFDPLLAPAWFRRALFCITLCINELLSRQLQQSAEFFQRRGRVEFRLAEACFGTKFGSRLLVFREVGEQHHGHGRGFLRGFQCANDLDAVALVTRQFAIDKIEISEETILLDYINRFFDSFTLNGITWIAAILYVAVCAIILLRFIYRKYRIPIPLFVLALTLFIVSTIFTGVKLDRDVFTRKGVVLAQQAEVKNGPGQDFNTKFTAHAGLVFNIEKEEAGYYWVNFENRLKGWIPKSVAAEI